MAFVCEAMLHVELGDQLRRSRESKSLSLEDLEKATGIRKRYLQAMEEGRFNALPGEIQARGFLKSYANIVGLNADEMLARYERQTYPALAAVARPITPSPVTQPTRPATPGMATAPSAAIESQAAPQPQSAAPFAPPASPLPPKSVTAPGRLPQLPSWLTLEVGLIALAVILVICVAVLAASLLTGPAANQQPAAAPRRTATRTAPPPPTVPPATPTVTPPANITASARTTSTVGYVQVALAATEHIWVRVTTDGQTAFEGMFAPGQALNWEAKQLLIVEASNGAGLTASFNGRPVGVLGPRGQLVARAWTPAGETAVPAKSASSLPTPSPTPQ